MGQLDGRVAVVTGAGRGIGREYALALAREGASVVVNDLSDGSGRSPADDVVAELRALRVEAVADNGDVSSPAAMEQLMSTAQAALGGIDIVIANAGILSPASIEAMPGEQWAKVLAVHVNGTFNCIHSAVPHLRQRGGGSIITTGSLATNLLFPGLAAYRSAKAAIVVLTNYAAQELADINVNVNSIMPGGTVTRMSDQFYSSLREDDGFLNASARRQQQGSGDSRPEPAPADTVPPLGVFLCTEAGRSISGRAFQLSGHKIALVTGESTFEFGEPARDGWSMEELAERIPQLLGAPAQA